MLLRRLRRDWRRHLVVVTPETVVRWHRAGWRLFWRWKSRTPAGRPRLSPEVRELIARVSRENPRWGTERIRGEVLKPGLAVSNRSGRRSRWCGPTRAPRRPGQTWRTFLRSRARANRAADRFTVQTLTFKTLYVLLFITQSRRELVHLAVTAHPTAAWVWRQLVAATPWGRRPKHLVRDRDSACGGDVRARAQALGIETTLTPVRAPRANAVAERVIGTLRRDCLDQLIPLDARHLRAILDEYVEYDNTARPHRTLQLDTPRPQTRPRTGPPHPVRSRPVLGGLHHVYECAA